MVPPPPLHIQKTYLYISLFLSFFFSPPPPFLSKGDDTMHHHVWYQTGTRPVLEYSYQHSTRTGFLLIPQQKNYHGSLPPTRSTSHRTRMPDDARPVRCTSKHIARAKQDTSPRGILRPLDPKKKVTTPRFRDSYRTCRLYLDLSGASIGRLNDDRMQPERIIRRGGHGRGGSLGGTSSVGSYIPHAVDDDEFPNRDEGEEGEEEKRGKRGR